MASALGMLTFSLISTLKQHVLYYRNKHGNAYRKDCLSLKVDTIIRRLRLLKRTKRKWNAAGSGTRAAPHPYSKMCELCELCELFVKKSHRFRDGIILFLLSRIYSLPSTSGTPEGQLEQPQASGTREALWNGPPLTRGVRGGFRSLF